MGSRIGALIAALWFPSLTYLNAACGRCYNWLGAGGGMLVWSDGSLPVRGRGDGDCPGSIAGFCGKWSPGLFLSLSLFFLPGSRGEKGTTVLAANRGDFFPFAGLFLGGFCRPRLFEHLDARPDLPGPRHHGFHLLPKYLWNVLLLTGSAALLLASSPILFLAWWSRKRPGSWPVDKIATILFLSGFGLAAARGWWRGGYDQFGKESVLAGCWLLGVAWTVWALSRKRRAQGERTEDGGRWKVGGVPAAAWWALVLTPFLLGFGTATSVADYAGQGRFFTAAGRLLLDPPARGQPGGCGSRGPDGPRAFAGSRVALPGRPYRLATFLPNRRCRFGPKKGRLRVDRGWRRPLAKWAELRRYLFDGDR